MLGAAVVCAIGWSCADRSTGTLPLAAVDPIRIVAVVGGDTLPFPQGTLRVRLRLGSGVVAADTAFPVGTSTPPPRLTLSLPTESPTTEVTVDVTLTNSGGTELLRADGVVVTARLDPPLQPPTPVAVPLRYVGPGATTATSLQIRTSATSGFPGDTITVTADVLDAAGAVIPGVPLVYRSGTPALVAVANPAAGRAELRDGRGTAVVQVRTYATLLDSVALRVQPLPGFLQVIGTEDDSGTVGAVLPSPIRLRVLGSDGQVISGMGIRLTLPTGAISADTLILTDTAGEARASVRLPTRAGQYAVTARVDRGSGLAIVRLTARPAAPDSLLVAGTIPASLVAGTTLPALEVRALDRFGNETPAFVDSVDVRLLRADTAVGPVRRIPTVAGRATIEDLVATAAGPAWRVAAASGTLRAGRSTPFEVRAAPAATLALLDTPAPTLVAGVTIAPLRVAVLDAFGNRATDFTGAFAATLAAGPDGATLGGTTSATAVRGEARFDALRLTRAGGPYVLRFSSGALPAADAPAITVSPAAPSALRVVTDAPASSVAGTPIGPILVGAVDEFGNGVPAFATPVTAALQANPGSATLGGTTNATPAGGTAAFGTLSLERAASGYVVRFTAAGLQAALTRAFDVTPAAAAALSLDQAPPTSIEAGAPVGPIVVSVRDAFGNLVASATGPIGVAFGANPGGAPLGGPTSSTVTNGTASFTGPIVERTGTGYTLQVAFGALTVTTAAFDVTPAAAASLAITGGPPASVAAGVTLGNVVVEARDRFGNLATGFSGGVSVTLDANPGATAIVGTTTRSAVGGVATFGDLQLTAAAAGYTLRFDATPAGTIPGVVSSAVTVLPAAPTALVVTTSPAATTTAGSNLAPVVVGARDAFGNAVPTFTGPVTATLATNPQGAVLGGTTTATPAGSSATFAALQVTTVGTGYAITFAAPGLSGVTTSAFAVQPAAAARLDITSTPTGAVAGAPLTPFAVTARDAFGNVATGFTGTVTVALGANPAGGALSGTISAVAAAGVATLSDVRLARAGTGYTVITSATGLVPDTTPAFAVAPAAAAALAFRTAPPASVTAGAAFGATVEVRDDFGNVATAFTGAVGLALEANGAGATLGGTVSVNAVAGVATYTALQVTRATTGLVARASAAGLTAGNSSAFAVTPAAATALAVTTGPPPVVGAGAAFGPVVVEARDAFANVVPGYATGVTVSLVPNTTLLGGTLTQVPASGVASFPALVVNAAGTFALQFTSGALTAATTSAFAVGGIVTNRWTNAAGGNWVTDANWSAGRAPLATDSVVIDQAGTYTVTLDAPFTGAWITIGGTTGTQTLALAATRTLTATAPITVRSGGVLQATSATLSASGGGRLDVLAGGVVRLTGATASLQVSNGGTVETRGASSISGALTNAAGATLLVGGNAAQGNATLSVPTFTNQGTIDLTQVDAGGVQTATLASTGTVTNAGTIRALPGTGTGSRTIAATLVNNGTVTVSQPLSLASAGAQHVNGTAGTIGVSEADLTIEQSGASPTFTNQGGITVGATRTLFVGGGTLVQAVGGTITGAGALVAGTGTTLQLAAGSAAPQVSNVTLTSATLGGLGTWTQAAGQTLVLNGATVAGTLATTGAVQVRGAVSVTGSLTTTAATGVSVVGGTTAAALSVTGSLIVAGTLTLTSDGAAAPDASLTTTGGLTIAAGGSLSVLVGTNGGARTINGAVSNAGTIALTSANLNLPGIGAAITNAGTITIPAGRTLTTSAATFNANAGGAIAGAGTFAHSTGGFVIGAGGAAPATDTVSFTGATISGGGFGATASQVVRLTATSVTAPFTVGPVVEVRGATAFGNTVTTTETSLLRIAGDGTLAQPNAAVTMSSGFTNNGVVELTHLAGAAATASLTVTGGTFTNAVGGTLRNLVGVAGGTRTVTATLSNAGRIEFSPGAASPLAVVGAFTNMASGTVAVVVRGAIAGTGHDVLQVEGAATLGGTLTATLGGGYVPAGGAVHDVLTATSTTGAFATVTLPAAFQSVTYPGTVVRLTGLFAAGLNSFTNAAGGAWSVPTNWSLGRVPVAGDSVVIAGAGTYAVTLDVAYTGTSITVGGGTGSPTLTLGAPALTLASALRLRSGGTVAANGASISGVGAAIIDDGATLSLANSTIALPVANAGLLLAPAGAAASTASLTGGLTTTATSVVRTVGNTAAAVTLAVTGAVTNNGLLELDAQGAGTAGAANTVSIPGGLVNAAGATIRTTATLSGAARTLATALSNQGTVTLLGPLALPANSATHTNSGTIALGTAELRVTLGGTGAAFTNDGAITADTAGRLVATGTGTWTQGAGGTFTGGTLAAAAGATLALDAAAAPDTLRAEDATVSLAAGVTTGGATMVVSRSTVNGAGQVTVQAGRTLTLSAATIGAALVNAGTIVVRHPGTSTLSGAVTTTVTSVIRTLSGTAAGESAILAITGDLDNAGLIELDSEAAGTEVGQASELSIAGLLTNQAGATLRATGNGTVAHRITGSVVNAGTLDLSPGRPAPLLIDGSFTNTGTLVLDAVSGTQHDALGVTGIATLGGTLTINGLAGYVGDAADQLEVLNAGSVVGTFATLALPAGLLSATYTGTTVTISGT